MDTKSANQGEQTTGGLRERLLAVYGALHEHFGHEPHWWPIFSDTPDFEIIVGTVLVQQTRWEAVEAAVGRLRSIGLLAPAALAAADTAALADLLRPCAFHQQKAPGLQAICRHILDRHGGDVAALLAQPRAALRAELLALPRIGPETADTIMLYAGGHPVFIVDAYTRRLFGRLDIQPGFDFARARYDAIQQLIENALVPWDPTTDHPFDFAQGRRPPTTDHQPRIEDGTVDASEQRSSIRDPRSSGSHFRSHVSRVTFHVSDIPFRASRYSQPDGSLRHFLWDFHALIVEACIHHCLASNPRQDRPGARRSFVDPRKCATHCITCAGCPLRPVCATYTRD